MTIGLIGLVSISDFLEVEAQNDIISLNVNSSATNLTRFLTYTDQDLGFRINYPENWNKQTDDLFDTAVVIFYAPNEEGTGLMVKFSHRMAKI
jgi:hypothetical protein